MPTFAESLAAARPPQVPFESLDWSALHPDRRQPFYDSANGHVSQDHIDSYAKTYPAPGMAAGASGTVDLAPLVEAGERLVVAEVAARDARHAIADAQAESRRRNAELALARETRNDLLRSLYRAGVSGPTLARTLNLSVVRVSQIVAGARG
jgi:hypothetical protein